MSLKESTIHFFNDIFENIGMDPLFGMTLLFIIMIVPTFGKLKVWGELPDYKKHFLIAGWIVALLSIITLIISFSSKD
ncbi:MAG TPA: hypothetical protein DHV28_02590 [Ignavibacteriales bacterium]|nr:hypothetical protein [Ignavibacteriales bacterium]